MNTNKTPLAAIVAVVASLSMPVAFAQTAPQPPTDAATADANSATMQAAPMQGTEAPASAEPKQVTWADLDGDKDGSLSKQEVAAVPALSQVFDQADADSDGKLTAEEYKLFAANAAGGGSDGASGG